MAMLVRRNLFDCSELVAETLGRHAPRFMAAAQHEVPVGIAEQAFISSLRRHRQSQYSPQPPERSNAIACCPD
jgi:hypothetical protein